MREAMAGQGLEALLCRLPENVLFLSGYWPLCGWVFYLFPVEGRPVCVVPDTEREEALSELWDAECVSYRFGTVDAEDQYEEIERAVKRTVSGIPWKRIGYERGFERIAPAYNAAEQYVPAAPTKALLVSLFGEEKLVDATDLIRRERAVKTPFEVEKIRVSNEIANRGLSAFVQKVDVGMRAVDLAASVEVSVMTEGTGYRKTRRVRAFAQVAVGAETSRAWRPMEITSERRLKKSDLALLELAVVADGYWSDRTRARVAGKASDQQKEIWNIVEQAQRRAIEVIRPGIEAGVVDRAARQFIHDVGHGKDFMHITGHGVGFSYHEKIPCICPGASDTLHPAMVHTVEPGIYFEGLGGIRIEDDVVVTEEGCEILAPFPRDIV
jgi:Xaa-Pro dipeptidase